MTPSSCPGNSCKYYRPHEPIWKKDRERDEFYQASGWHCHSPRALETNKPNRKTGGVPIGLVANTCKGLWYEAKV